MKKPITEAQDGPNFETLEDLEKIARDNPAWSNRILLENWDKMERAVGEEHMPKRAFLPWKKEMFIEYGEGIYGVVLPTRTKDVVLKITTDDTEAWFVRVALAMNHWPKGLVRYYAVAQLHGERKHDATFALWREEASRVGKVEPNLIERFFGQADAYERFTDRMDIFRQAATYLYQLVEGVRPRTESPLATPSLRIRTRKMPKKEIRDAIKHYKFDLRISMRDWKKIAKEIQKYKGLERASYVFHVARETAYRMSLESPGNLVGSALLYYADRAIFLADVHEGNIGFAMREAGPGSSGPKVKSVVITDPGVAFSIRDDLHRHPASANPRTEP